MDALDRLRQVLECGDEAALRCLLQEIVPTYHPENGGRDTPKKGAVEQRDQLF